MTQTGMTRVLLGIRGLEKPDQADKISSALKKIPGVQTVKPGDKGQIEVEYDAQKLTVMDLIRTVREQGFLAGML
jgi:copper chaperone